MNLSKKNHEYNKVYKSVMIKKVVLLFLVTMSMNVFAQKEVKEGVMNMKMTMSSDNEQVNASLAMMGDMVMTIYFKENKSRSEMKNPMSGNTTTIVDNKSKKTLVLMDNAGGKNYMLSDIDMSEESLKGLTITAKKDTKTIAGYVCKGYDIVGKKDGADINMALYTTDKVSAPNQNTASFGNKINGTPLYMVMNVTQMGMAMKITMEVTEVKGETVADGKFDMTVPEGYTKMEMPKPANVD